MNRTLLQLIISLCLLIPMLCEAKPRTRNEYDVNNENFARVKVFNETREALLCYVSIDGYKIRFRLSPRGQSIWYKATDTRFNYTDFHTWCDYLSNYPQFQDN